MSLPAMEGTIAVVRDKNLIFVRFTSLTDLGEKLAWLTTHGFESYFSAKANASADVIINSLTAQGALATNEMQLQSTTPLMCPIHGKPMKPSEHGGWFCSKKVGNGYCGVSVKDGVWKGLPK